MSSKSWCVILAVLAIAAFEEVGSVSASGWGARGSHPGARGAAEWRRGVDNGWGNSGHFLRAENGIFGSPWAYGNAYRGWGYPGWGYSPLAFGYDLESVPYFAQFPPVYYGYGENVPVQNPFIRSSWAGSESPPPVAESSAAASRPRPPLRMINPYCVEAKAD